jgi:hypothetical protein
MDRAVPSRDDTTRVLKQLEDLTTEAQQLSQQLSELARTESTPRPNPRKNHDAPQPAPLTTKLI